jgi:hypothetical protein
LHILRRQIIRVKVDRSHLDFKHKIFLNRTATDHATGTTNVAQNDGLTEFLRKKVLQKRSGSHVPNDIVHFFGEFVGVRQRVLAVIIATAGEFLYREIERVDFF